MADVFKQIVEANAILDGTYVEPFVGGGSVALSLLLNDYVSRIVINDKDRSIYAFWHSVVRASSKAVSSAATTRRATISLMPASTSPTSLHA